MQDAGEDCDIAKPLKENTVEIAEHRAGRQVTTGADPRLGEGKGQRLK